MTVTLPADVVGRFERFSLYNSPYRAHDRGCAIDLYPPVGTAPSPVPGVVRDVRTVRAPQKPYAPEHDHLILVDVDRERWDGDAEGIDVVARILHVEPAVEPGAVVAVGDDLGETIRAGFFAPWVGDHLHVGFRRPSTNLYRASGSLPVTVDVELEPLSWDGTGRVVEVGDTSVVLDEPARPGSSSGYAGIAAEIDDDGRSASVALDGGLPHYDGGGVFGDRLDGSVPVSLLGERVGVATGRDVTWDDVTVLANGEPVTGLSLFADRTDRFGAKIVCPGHSFAVGDRVSVSIRRRSGETDG